MLPTFVTFLEPIGMGADLRRRSLTVRSSLVRLELQMSRIGLPTEPDQAVQR